MKTVFITGSSGFVGGYLRKEFEKQGYKVVGTDLRSGAAEYIMDVTDAEAVDKVVGEVRPEYIVHLAGFASVKESFNRPELCHKINVEGTRNIFNAITKHNLSSRVLAISSGDTYAESSTRITETDKQIARSPYGESRLKQEELIKTFTNVDWIIARSFPHVGPGQPLGFVTSDFASQIAGINKEEMAIDSIKVGNLEGIRDFTDVRDTVIAYRLLLEAGKSHEVYNVCSGKGIKIAEILEILLSFSQKKIEIQKDDSLVRSNDIKYNVGDNSKLVNDTGWKQEIEMQETLKEIYDFFYQQQAQ